MTSAQSTDPVVSRKKFNREINEFRSLSDEYCQRGWFMSYAKYPHALVILATAKTNPITILSGVFFDYTNYDVVPPSVKLVNPITAKPYKFSELPTHLPRLIPASEQTNEPKLQPFMVAHDQNDIPFLCLAGVREYHEHPAHSGDSWELHRPSGAGRLIRLIEIISKYGLETINGLSVQMTPIIGFNFNVPPE